ncbi:MAG: alginate lyase family protein [Pirellulales bacterium]|nr:alginate lyase family protein [Pirellulales bacterium]
MNRPQLAWNVLTRLGPRIAWLRAEGLLKKMSGWNRRHFRARKWSDIDLPSICIGEVTVNDYADFKRRNSPQFLFPIGRPPDGFHPPESHSARQPDLRERLKFLKENRCVNFFRAPTAAVVDATSPDHLWSSSDLPWYEVPDFLSTQGDIRTLWEPSRAAWALDLARANGRADMADASALFWRWVDSWMRCCPPWQGLQWKCGQEAAVRFLAMAIGFWTFADDPASTPEHFVQFARLAWATGYRIEKHVHYARSQKNNHALSEACGLMLIGHLFPEFRDADNWFDRGRSIFCDELRRQVYADGTYLQNSMNYHRVMLQMSIIATLLARWHGCPFDSETIGRIGRAEEFLFQMLDEKTGQAPLYGNNDGALVLPLSECDFNDMRPAVQAAHFLVTGRRRFPAGPWDEDLLWLFGKESLSAPQEPSTSPTSSAFRQGGYYTLRSRESWGMIRCHTHRDRPGQYDQLHFDLWWRGQNVLHDSGTYLYFPAEGRACEDYFQLARSHNIVEIDGTPPVERVSRFLYFPWPKGRLRHFEADVNGVAYFEGEHFDYDRKPWRVLCRRAIARLNGDVWLIVDDLLGQGHHSAVLRWHLPDVPMELDAGRCAITVQMPVGDCHLALLDGCEGQQCRWSIVRGQVDSRGFQGFTSLYYGVREVTPTLEAEVVGRLPIRLISVFSGDWPITLQRGARARQNEIAELKWKEFSWQIECTPPMRQARRIVANITPLTIDDTSPRTRERSNR